MCSSTFQYFSVEALHCWMPWTSLDAEMMTKKFAWADWGCSDSRASQPGKKMPTAPWDPTWPKQIGPCFRVEFEDLVYWPLPHQCATKKHQLGMQHVHASLVLFFWTTLLAYPSFFHRFANSEVTISYKFNWDHQAKVNYFDAIFQPQGPKIPKDCRCSNWKK